MRTHNLDTQSGHIRVSTPDLRRARHGAISRLQDGDGSTING